MTEISERSLAVLRAIVQDYIDSREPVGSKAIVQRHAFGVSAATIRNDMALLEEEDLISAPHTSSGRIPTDKGYRVFVDQLAELRPLSTSQKNAIERFLGDSVDLDDVLSRTVRLLSQLTQQVALVQYPRLVSARVTHVELVGLTERRVMTVLIADNGRVEQRISEVPESVTAEALTRLKGRLNEALGGVLLTDLAARLDEFQAAPEPADSPLAETVAGVLRDSIVTERENRLAMAGVANLARTEQDFPSTITPILDAIEEQVTLIRLFSEMESTPSGLSVRIGSENRGYGLTEASVLAGGYSSGRGGEARIAVLGPTRMDYSRNMVAVRAVARYLSRLLGGE